MIDYSSSSSPSADILPCSTPLTERRLTPRHEQALECPRCGSTYTKFCYYNNYSLSQPRYFCKTCRRYWTKGGNLRNIPVGGGCRKNKKPSNSKKQPYSNDGLRLIDQNHPLQNPTDLQLSFPEDVRGGIFMEGTLENPGPVDFMGSEFQGLHGPEMGIRSHDFMGINGSDFGTVGGRVADLDGHLHHGCFCSNFNGFCSSLGASIDDGNDSSAFMDSFQRLKLPSDGDALHDLKPDTNQDQDGGCSSDRAAGTESFLYDINDLTPWGGGTIMNAYGKSTTEPLI
ncbi:hypothetical protein Nepgr_018636 [Nepenthes gracilis]|uniref:Dof zinc finger protein n=1 Tax=Nepenthes gracilis TaxID=150966 RepID=A0AAD3STN7_NEPGR|nr:hypothetical protein Nepgr_018636 [Nepenthes gracilis]